MEAAWIDSELERIHDLCAPDVVVHDATNPTPVTGPDGYTSYIARRTDTYPDLDLRIDEVTAVNGAVALYCSALAGPGDPKNEGDELTFTGIEVMQVEDDQNVEWFGTLVEDTSLEAFVEGFHGRVIRPGDPDYDDARAVWNGVIDRYPALIAKSAGVADVMDTVNFVREMDMLVSVRGGGHNVAGSAVCNGGLVIDLSEMNGIRVDLDAQTARAEGTAQWADLDWETQRYGLGTPGGVVSTTGIAGLTLGGGVGWLRCTYGMTIDNLVSVDLVTADGDFLTVSEYEHPDLFWGIRGGSGNFGVVTSFEYRLHPVDPEVMFVEALYPLDTAPKILPAWREFMKTAPNEISSQAVFWSIPAFPDFPEAIHGEPIVATHCGPVEKGRQALASLRELDEPLVDLSGPAPFTEVQQLYDPFFPEGE